MHLLTFTPYPVPLVYIYPTNSWRLGYIPIYRTLQLPKKKTRVFPGWCSTLILLLICSSFSRENGHPLFICSSLSMFFCFCWVFPPLQSSNPPVSLIHKGRTNARQASEAFAASLQLLRGVLGGLGVWLITLPETNSKRP